MVEMRRVSTGSTWFARLARRYELPFGPTGGCPAIRAHSLCIGERGIGSLEIGKDGDEPLARSSHRRHLVCRVLAPEDVERARSELKRLHAFVSPGQETSDAVVVGIRVAPQRTAVLEPPAGERGLQQDGDGELRAIEMPVELFAGPIGHHVDAAEWIRHRIELGFAHRRSQDVDERLPLVDLRDHAGRESPQMVRLTVTKRLSAGWSASRSRIPPSK